MKYFKYTNNKNGFTLLLAVLITSIILSMSVGISVFIIRELLISSTGRESQKAFFAADSGVECALYWDLKQNAFATSSTQVIFCAGSSPSAQSKTYIASDNLIFSSDSEFAVSTDTRLNLAKETIINGSGTIRIRWKAKNTFTWTLWSKIYINDIPVQDWNIYTESAWQTYTYDLSVIEGDNIQIKAYANADNPLIKDFRIYASPAPIGASGISEFDLTFTNGACVHVKVDKTIPYSTQIDSAGHNTCNLSDTNRVERTLHISY